MARRLLARDLPGIQAMLNGIYDQHDRHCYPSIKDLVLKLIWSLGKFSSAERKGNGGKTPRYLADTFAWWVAVCSFLSYGVEDVLWEKYPRVCIYCGVRKDCSCEGKKFGIAVESIESNRRKNRRPLTMHGWQRMFAEIYGKQNAKYGLDHALGRLPEEVTELIECLLPTIEDPIQLKLELSDIGARIFSLAHLLHIDLEEVLLGYYRGICPGCQQSNCCCRPHAK